MPSRYSRPDMISTSPLGSSVVEGYQRGKVIEAPGVHGLITGSNVAVCAVPSSWDAAYAVPPATKTRPSARTVWRHRTRRRRTGSMRPGRSASWDRSAWRPPRSRRWSRCRPRASTRRALGRSEAAPRGRRPSRCRTVATTRPRRRGRSRYRRPPRMRSGPPTSSIAASAPAARPAARFRRSRPGCRRAPDRGLSPMNSMMPPRGRCGFA